ELTMAQVKSLEEPLLSHREADEVAELDQFWLGEVAVQLFPQLIVGQPGIPGDRLGPPQRRLLPFGQDLRLAEIDDLVVGAFGQALLGSEMRALARAISA